MVTARYCATHTRWAIFNLLPGFMDYTLCTFRLHGILRELLCIASFLWHNSFKVHPWYSMSFVPWNGWVLSLCMAKPHFNYPFIAVGHFSCLHFGLLLIMLLQASMHRFSCGCMFSFLSGVSPEGIYRSHCTSLLHILKNYQAVFQGGGMSLVNDCWVFPRPHPDLVSSVFCPTGLCVCPRASITTTSVLLSCAIKYWNWALWILLICSHFRDCLANLDLWVFCVKLIACQFPQRRQLGFWQRLYSIFRSVWEDYHLDMTKSFCPGAWQHVFPLMQPFLNFFQRFLSFFRVSICTLKIYISILFFYCYCKYDVFLISFAVCSLLLSRNTIDVCFLIFYPETLLNSCTICNCVYVDSLGFCIYKVMISACRYSFTSSFPLLLSFVSFSWLIALARKLISFNTVW